MEKQLLLGDEAIAQGALDAGLSGVYSYPGTPSTEVTEFIQNSKVAAERNIIRMWNANEKTSLEAALGMSYMGKRAIVCMKHVGMNVAADPFMNAAMCGANGGVVVVAADDPSMHSSQNEQDSRFYGKFAFVPVLEPSNQQECYEATRYAFDLSEKFKIPVMMRIPTRLAHSRSVVERKPAREPNQMALPTNPGQWIAMPATARRRYVQLLADQDDFMREASESGFNKYIEGDDKSMGIIACGIGYNYLMENCGKEHKHPILKISQYPIPTSMVERLVDECEKVLVIEEGQPVVEQDLRGMLNRGVKVLGRLDGTLPRTGELTPDAVRSALGLSVTKEIEKSDVVAVRPPALCQGCGHRDLYTALNQLIKEEYPNSKVFSDIGCYTLGSLAPFHAIDSCVDMGASITMARGASEAGLHPSIAVIGDSTFTHSGITGLLDCVNAKANVTIVISDNLTTAMTGGQDSAGTGKMEDICIGVGADPKHVRVIVPLPKNYDEMKAIMREEINYKGVSVIISRRECKH